MSFINIDSTSASDPRTVRPLREVRKSQISAVFGALISLGAAHIDAATYALSPDGLSVVRIVSSSSVSASAFDSSLLPSGYTSSTATGGSVAVTTYEAGYKSGTGGGHIEAQFTPSSPPAAGQSLKWVQVGTDNDPIPGYPSPYLDTQSPGGVFYNWAGSTTTLPSGKLPFYDFSRRNPADLSTINPIVWNANLFPTVVDASNNIEVHNGVSWGWTMEKAPVGTTSATFTNPAPGSATVTGVGTSSFSWGSGEPSTLSFTGTSFDTTPGTKFKIGTLTFHNGVIVSGSDANSVDFNAPLHFTNIPELDFTFKTTFSLVNTLNIDGDPDASADQVSIGAFGYTFNVLEGRTASVDVMATLDTSLVGTPAFLQANGSDFDSGPLDPSPTFIIGSISLANPSDGGFITQATPVPEPSATWWVVMLLSSMIFLKKRRQFTLLASKRL